MLIAFEGLEGVGKTTLGRLAAERLNLAYIKSPPPDLNSVRGYVADRSDARAGFYFYLCGLYALQQDLCRALANKRGVLVDRYLLSTIAYWNGGRSFDPPAHDASGLVPPDLTLRITCNERARTARISSRGFHIYERAPADEPRIDEFIAARCDLDFHNNDDLEQSLGRLCGLLDQRLREHE